ncbi:MAG: hypothetical protein WKG01_23580 [Kofleriaceae bacterium]
MRALAVILVTSLVGSGCVANSYRIPATDLQRIAASPPAQRAERVRVVQEISGTDVAPAERVDTGTQIIFVPNITITAGPRHRHVGGGGGGIGSGVKGGGSGGSGSDGRAAAIAVVVLAAVGLFVVAGIEGSRFDGWARLHPMHPVHLIGKNGQYMVMPLAWIDPQTAAWTERAVVRPSEGPWLQLDRAPLTRTGATYGVYGGSGSLRSAHGDLGIGPSFTIQGGYFPNQYVGILASVFLGWRENRLQDTLFESRYTVELQALPVALGPLHAGGYVGAGFAYRAEDNVMRGYDRSSAYAGGAMLQLDINTRIALTARFGMAKTHEERTRDLMVGLSVY